MVSASPTQSKAWSAPRPPVSPRTSLARLPPACSTCVAPIVRASSSFSGDRSTTITSPAWASRAPCTTDSPTPPSPTTSTDCPGSTFAVFRTAPTPVMTAQPTRAACSSGTPSGTGSTARSLTTVDSANPPVDRPG